MISYAGGAEEVLRHSRYHFVVDARPISAANPPRNVEEKIEWQELSWSVTSVFAVSYRPEFNYAH